jgi:allantoinase
MSVPAPGASRPTRERGLDHRWFAHRTILDAPVLEMPAGKRVALLICVPVEFFPLDMPAQPYRGRVAFDRPYPDPYGYANRDYGNRVGIYRLMRVFDRLGVRATAFVDAASTRRYPHVVKSLAERSWELAASGVDRGHLHHSGLDRSAESALVTEALDAVRSLSPAPVIGWQSPALSESAQTLELLAANGVQYVSDWANDELPFTIDTSSGTLTALPVSFELSDLNMLVRHDVTVEEYAARCLAAWVRLGDEAARGGSRVLSLTVTPWILGYPHRIRALASLLERLLDDPFGWNVTASELARSYEARHASG